MSDTVAIQLGFATTKPVAQAKPRPFFSRLFRKPLAIITVLWIVLMIFIGLGATWIAPYDPLQQDLFAIKQLPSPEHWLGTDALGRDVLSRLIYGAGPAIAGVFQALAVAAALGIVIGLVGGYFGKLIDKLLAQFTDLLLALPSFVILLSVLAVFQRDMTAAMVVLGIMGSAGIARVIRSATLGVREELYIEAARISGLGDTAIISRHVLPRIVGPMIVQLSLFASTVLLAQTGITFLGLGPKPPTPTWGGMVYEASTTLADAPWLLIPSGAIIALTIFAFGLLGDAARDAVAEGWSRSSASLRKPRPIVSTSSSTHSAELAATTEISAHTYLSVRDLTIVSQNGEEQRVLVQNLDLDLDRGETIGIVGESGSGKTLTSLALIGLLPAGTHAISGRMVLDGVSYDLTKPNSLRKLRGGTVGMIFQEPMAALDPCFTIEHHLVEVIRLHESIGRGEAKQRAIELLEQVRIPEAADVAKRYPHQVSGGMAQRVGIARTLASNPGLLLADEPTTALDVTVQAEILDLIADLSEENSMSVLFVTHDWGVVADICDRALVLYHGQTLEQASVADIFAHPQHPYTKALLSSNPHNAPVGEPLPTVQESLSRILEEQREADALDIEVSRNAGMYRADEHDNDEVKR